MKKIVSLIICGIVLTTIYGCTENNMVKNFGGTETITLESGKRLVNLTWKEKNNSASLWLLTKMDTTIKPNTYSFKEKSSLGVMEGEVIIKEQK